MVSLLLWSAGWCWARDWSGEAGCLLFPAQASAAEPGLAASSRLTVAQLRIRAQRLHVMSGWPFV